MNNSVDNILKKITYIEADIEIQKQILHSTPSRNEKDIENILIKIKQAKDQIQQLRDQLAEASPHEYQKLLAIEKAVAAFREIASQEQFEVIESISTHPQCAITLQDGKQLSCLVRARDANGNWTIITTEGELCRYSEDEVNVGP